MKTQCDRQVTVHDSFQDIFDYVAEKLMEQGERAVDRENYCLCVYRYYAEDKILTCAVGCLIPDEQYREGFEEVGDGLEYVLAALGLDTRKGEDFTERVLFLIDLQRAHDNAVDVNFRISFRNNMTDLANKYKLDTTQLDKVYWYGVMSESSC